VIEVAVVLHSRHSTLERVEVRGHSGRTGNSVVCAAVSALARTAAHSIEEYGKFAVEGNADSPGNLYFSVAQTEGTGSGDYIWLMGVTDNFLTGIRDIEREHPEECTMEVVTGGNEYGS
jgi:uncharacterized protein YsxB (DUF464 family)